VRLRSEDRAPSSEYHSTVRGQVMRLRSEDRAPSSEYHSTVRGQVMRLRSEDRPPSSEYHSTVHEGSQHHVDMDGAAHVSGVFGAVIFRAEVRRFSDGSC
jgi:hypothetical protein